MESQSIKVGKSLKIGKNQIKIGKSEKIGKIGFDLNSDSTALGQTDGMGLGWMVIIGHRSSKSTFGADKKSGITLNTNAPDPPSNRK